MASEEHKKLADYVKDVHSSLRQLTQQLGAERAWIEHCSKTEVLQKYAQSMERLATKHWEPNCSDTTKPATSRIEWAANFCHNYFIEKDFKMYRNKEAVIAEKINLKLNTEENFSERPKLIDIGSCFNPFREYEFLDVLAIDLCPANKMVLTCDILKLHIGSESEIKDGKVMRLQELSFEVVTFCFVLEYIPSSELRILACEKAYSLLKPGGLLIINTPDSKHVGANCKIMKCWRYALALMGFTRIKYEKLAHMHCMAFRKALIKDTAVRWAHLHQEPYMQYTLNIPQDGQDKYQVKEDEEPSSKIQVSVDDFIEMPLNTS